MQLFDLHKSIAQIDQGRHVGYSRIDVLPVVSTLCTVDFELVHDWWHMINSATRCLKYLDQNRPQHSFCRVLCTVVRQTRSVSFQVLG